ncbi:MAG: ATP-binding cassette domain-containing protein [Bacteroidales bacterium]|jgi:subfamily B ATP-binding cassette protein MsbA|nr:ATP-binding cassette domain-containing protein [Bacteroidales bacterium]
MKDFLRLLSFAKPYGRYWPKYVVFTIIGTIAGTLNFVLIAPALEVIFEGYKGGIPENPVMTDGFIRYLTDYYYYWLAIFTESHGVMGAVLFVVGIVFLASMIANAFRYFSQRTLTSLRTNVVKNIRKAIYDKICRLNVGFFQQQRKGDILSSISSDVTEVQASVVNSFQVIFREPLMIIVSIAILFIMSYQLTLFTLIALPAATYFIGRLAKKLKSTASESQHIMGQILSIFEETISGIKIIKAFNAEKYVTEQFDEVNNRHRSLNKRIMNRIELASPMSEFLGVAIVCLIILYAAVMMLNYDMDMSITKFVAYLGVYYNLLAPAKNLANSYSNINRGMASGQRIFAILDQQNAITEPEQPAEISGFTDKIEFRDVSFQYATEPVLMHIDLTIPKGKTYALVGHSGAGKSTIADLIPRFYDVTSGSLCIDGTDIRQYRLNDLTKLMGIVTQEPILFNDTVFNNIAFGIKDVTEEQVIAAARIANAHEFIEPLENGYYTNIGDRGSRLSGGQRQRLAIARAVLKNPPILILDEATSALDTESERLVQDALTKLMTNRTSIVIAHRLSTIKHADCICVLEAGSIIEQGTHNELLAVENGVYKHLHSMQVK